MFIDEPTRRHRTAAVLPRRFPCRKVRSLVQVRVQLLLPIRSPRISESAPFVQQTAPDAVHYTDLCLGYQAADDNETQPITLSLDTIVATLFVRTTPSTAVSHTLLLLTIALHTHAPARLGICL